MWALIMRGGRWSLSLFPSTHLDPLLLNVHTTPIICLSSRYGCFNWRCHSFDFICLILSVHHAAAVRRCFCCNWDREWLHEPLSARWLERWWWWCKCQSDRQTAERTVDPTDSFLSFHSLKASKYNLIVPLRNTTQHNTTAPSLNRKL